MVTMCQFRSNSVIPKRPRSQVVPALSEGPNFIEIRFSGPLTMSAE